RGRTAPRRRPEGPARRPLRVPGEGARGHLERRAAEQVSLSELDPESDERFAFLLPLDALGHEGCVDPPADRREARNDLELDRISFEPANEGVGDFDVV